MSAARFHTPERQPLSSDMELYEKVFAAFGVSTSQFSYLMSQGIRYRASPGSVMVKGGKRWEKVALIVSGEAVAYKHDPSLPDGTRGPISHRYQGKLSPEGTDEASKSAGGVVARGSVIGGSALADRDLVEENYPADVVASTHVDWIEWNLHELEQLIDAPRWRSVQVCFYYMLYVDLLSTLDRDRAAKLHKEVHKEEPVPKPSTKQLVQLSIFVAVPFCGFGFADNFIMIVAGDSIDSHFGVALGLSTLAAAGLGNWLSDVVGLGLGDMIERTAQKLGISDGKLSPGQLNLASARFATLASKIIGISAGCFLGMVPLQFLTSNKKEFAKEDLDLYDEVFRPNGVSTHQFAELMELGTKKWAHTGATIVTGGVPHDKVTLLLRGEVTAYPHKKDGVRSVSGASPIDKPVCYYVGRLENDGPSRQEDRAVPSRGSIIGGARLAEPSLRDKTYPNDVVACKNVEWVEWDFAALETLMKEDDQKAIQASFYSMLFSELVRTLHKAAHSKEMESYQLLVRAVISDGIIDDKERAFLIEHKTRFQITDEEHFTVMAENGWSKEDWERGSIGSAASQHRLMRAATVRRPQNTAEALVQLQRVQSIIEGVMQSMDTSSDAAGAPG